jgi:hypothetical protein
LRIAARHPIGEGARRIRRHWLPGRERQGEGRRIFRNDANDLSFESEQVAHADHTANT